MGKRLGLLLLLAFVADVAHANDFPTRARVEFVLKCMQDTKAPPEEAMYKCSCAIDAIATKVKYEQWVDMSTVANGMTIAGERGGVMRDIKDGRSIATSYRTLQENAKKACFIRSD
ncbi:MAG TPA: hypothetical protein VLI21_05765 [Casimicrobiaceae bacterium]|nr:hypothetical protein [Casimicrobiaceae bacterium]